MFSIPLQRRAKTHSHTVRRSTPTCVLPRWIAAVFYAAVFPIRTATLESQMRTCFSILLFVTMLLVSPFGRAAEAQTTVPAVLLSDIHFDPFHEPGKLPQLRAAPIERWPAILSAAPTLTQEADLAALQVQCHALALDTAWPLLTTALKAAKMAEPRPAFVTLSGDLLAHEFPCRFQKLAPTATPAEYAAFAAKTATFVIAQLRLSFPQIPIYVALGNNDSGCADYRETPGSAFLRSTMDAVLAAARSSLGAQSSDGIPVDVSSQGDYSVRLPAQLRHGRLLVLQDIFDARQYNNCADAADRAPERLQLTWLRAQLTQARAQGEQVWVMGHIPPGIDAYPSFHRYVLRPSELCAASPQPFLADTALADTLLEYADVVRLALFGHTHMDEVRLLHRAGAPTAQQGKDGRPGPVVEAAVPLKLVPSVTPFFGNHPAFLLATINPHTLALQDWQTFVSPAAENSAAPWAEAYRFSTAYHLPEFSAETLNELSLAFASDRTGRAPRSATYRQHFYAGDLGLYALGLGQIWPAYACVSAKTVPRPFTSAFVRKHRQPCLAGGPENSPECPSSLENGSNDGYFTKASCVRHAETLPAVRDLSALEPIRPHSPHRLPTDPRYGRPRLHWLHPIHRQGQSSVAHTRAW